MSASERTRSAMLVLRAQSGDRAALEALLRRLEPMARGLALRMTRDHAAADDITQEALWSVCRGLGALRDPLALDTWMYRTVARLVFHGTRRRAGRAVTPLPDAEPVRGHADADPLITAEQAARLAQEIERLSPNTQVVVWLHYTAGLSLAETAAALEIPPGTVKSRLASGLAQLRIQLEGGPTHDA